MTWEQKYKQMAYYFIQLTEGDTYMMDDAFDLMRKDGLVDEDGFWIYEEDDEDKS
jgi:flagellar basal body rod protein FlgG